MAQVDYAYDTLDDALRVHAGHYGSTLASTTSHPLTSDWDAQKSRVFRSVFRTDVAESTSTATPASAAAPPLVPGSDDVILSDVGDIPGPADDQIRFDRAWHVITTRIVLPAGVAAEDSFGTLPPESQFSQDGGASEGEFREALHLVLHVRTELPRATHTDDILSWHALQVRRHYAQHLLPLLAACTEAVSVGGSGSGSSPASDPRFYDRHMMVVQHSVRTLEAAFRLYFYGLMLIVRGLTPAADGSMTPEADAVVSRFRQDLHALVANSASPSLMRSIRIILARITSVLLGMASEQDSYMSATAGAPMLPKPPADTDAEAQALRQRMHEMLASLHDVGLAGQSFQVLFAEIMDQNMTEFIRRSFAGRWAEADDAGATGAAAGARPLQALRAVPASSIAMLYDWVEHHFARLAHEVLGHIGRGKRDAVSVPDVMKWKETALGRLSALRMGELFDIVLEWPRSRGGLADLRVSVTTPQRRSQLVAAFTTSLRKRLLHPACSTLEILQTYIGMIRTFHVLDPSNVLLSSVVGQLQLYLCQRDDAVRIVVDGLLAEPGEKSEPGGHKLVELAAILNDPSQQRRRHIDEEELDWNDMEWVPDPIDAGTNYRRPKSEDVIGTLINALGSREAFTKEFQNIIAERLLSAQVVFAKEVKVLNLLKKRFGEGSMQNCEVMIRDIQDSNRLDALIHQLMRQDRAGGGWPRQHAHPLAARDDDQDAGLRYQAKILSRLYWPGLSREHFLLPTPVANVQKQYEEGYEKRKSSRKLAWMNQLGRATVELELADRTVSVECKTYEAAVIYAFQQETGGGGSESDENAPVHRTVAELVEMLQADEDLVELALVFWQKQGVLRPDAGRGADTYVVVERLGEENAATKAEPAVLDTGMAGVAGGTGGTGAGSSRKTRADDAQRTVYWQFIVGMLTNSAATMPLTQIAMMMKMLMAEGFPWSNEELLEFLGEKVADGDLELTGGKYRLVKK